MPNNLPTKAELERLKIKAEIDEIKRPFYLKAGFYSSISPIILGVIGIIYSNYIGFFDVQNQKLDNKRFDLQVKNDSLRRDSSVLAKDKLRLIEERNRIKENLASERERLQQTILQDRIELNEEFYCDSIDLVALYCSEK